MSAFEEACVNAAPVLGTLALRTLADRIAAGWPDDAILGANAPEFVETTRAVLVEKGSSRSTTATRQASSKVSPLPTSGSRRR